MPQLGPLFADVDRPQSAGRNQTVSGVVFDDDSPPNLPAVAAR